MLLLLYPAVQHQLHPSRRQRRQATKQTRKTAGDAKDQASRRTVQHARHGSSKNTDKVKDSEATEEATKLAQEKTEGQEGGVGKAIGNATGTKDATDKVGNTVQGTIDTAGGIAEGATRTVGDETAGDATGGATGKVGETIGDAEGTAEGTEDEGAVDVASETVKGAEEQAEELDENAPIKVKVAEQNLPNTSILEGLSINKMGNVVDKMGNHLGHIERGKPEEQPKTDSSMAIYPIRKMMTENIDRVERQPEEERSEENLIKTTKPRIKGGRNPTEANGVIHSLGPDGIEITKPKLEDMQYAKKELNALCGLAQLLFQIIAAVGLPLSGVLGLVGKLLNALGLGGSVNVVLGGLGLNKVLDGLGLGSVVGTITWQNNKGDGKK
ncbi:hypothetical protein PG985_005690 [Apiospora marii]|uniref:uncharacterized protein n=1 Tax=Apiospora marii TaxID=335849 RepID=UPI003131F541